MHACIVIVPNGVNISDWSRINQVILKGEPAVLYVGRLSTLRG